MQGENDYNLGTQMAICRQIQLESAIETTPEPTSFVMRANRFWLSLRGFAAQSIVSWTGYISTRSPFMDCGAIPMLFDIRALTAFSWPSETRY